MIDRSGPKAASPGSALLVRSDVRLAGPGKLMLGIAEGLRDRGWRVVIASGGGDLVEQFESAGFVHHQVAGLRIGDRSPASMLRGARQLRAICRTNEIDVAHSFNAQAGLLAWAASRRMKLHVVNTVLGSGMERLLPHLPFRLIAVSAFVRDNLIAHGVPADRIDIAYNGIIATQDVLAGKREFVDLWGKRNTSGRFRFVSIAMMHGDKGHRDIIDASRLILAADPNVDFEVVMIGDGERRPMLEAYAAENGLSERVEFYGATDDVYAALDEGHGFIHLSRQETFGMVIAEAQARGLPAICYRVGGIPEVVDEPDCGILVESGDVTGVSVAMRQFLSDRDQVMDMGEAALERARSLFTRPALAARIEEIYGNLKH